MNDLFFQSMAFFYIMKDPNMIKNYNKKFFADPTIIGIFDIVKDFVCEYKTEPTPEQIYSIIKMEGKDDVITFDSINALWKLKDELPKYGEEWIRNATINWGKFRSFYTSLENTIAYTQSIPPNTNWNEASNYVEKASKIFSKGVSFSVDTSEGHDFFDFENHIIKAEDTHTTGYKFMDLCLCGGFTTKGLYVIMGAPKVGKSQWLCNLAANSVKNGFDTVYITLEMSYQKVSRRIGSNMYNIDIDKYDTMLKDKNYMANAAKNFNNSLLKPAGKFIIEEFPTSSASASDIENFILKKEAELTVETGKEFKFKNVFIDYLNIMRDQKGFNGDNTYTKIKSICEDVRAMAQRNQWAVISLTQVNGNGYESTNLTMSDVSESKGLTATVDALFGIIRTQMMRANNVYYLQAIALRDSPHNGDKKKYIFDPNHLKITEDDSENIIPDTFDVPAIYCSATANEVSKYNKKRGAAPQQNPATYSQPELSNNANLSKAEQVYKDDKNALFDNSWGFKTN